VTPPAIKFLCSREIAMAAYLAGKNHSIAEIAEELRLHPVSVRTNLAAVGVPIRTPAIKGAPIEVVISSMCALRKEAHKRHLSPSQIASMILEAVVSDDLTAAVLDD
jgi:hypothetical protein